MSHTPTGPGSVRSRAPSRTFSKSQPRALSVPPSLRPSPSLSNLHIHSHNIEGSSVPPVPLLPNMSGRASELHSAASSVINMDISEGILLQDADITAEEAEDVIAGIVGVSAIGEGEPGGGQMDDETKDALREHLRKTLRDQTAKSEISPQKSSGKGKQREVEDVPFETVARFPPRQYFALTDAGKPVFVSRPGSDDSSDLDSSTIFGIMQALISVYMDDGDKLRYINAGRTRISFLLRPPLYYACVSSWGEPESLTRSHLEYLHLQILSIVSAAQLRRIFERRTNFDLRRLLNGAENLLYSMLERLEFDLAISTSSLQVLRLDGNLRRKIGDILVPPSKMKDVLYVVLIAQGKVVTLIRPKKHSIHPADIQILLNTIHSPSIMNSPASSSWIPVCLPKYNPGGFVNAYISFLRRSGDSTVTTPLLETNMSPENEGGNARAQHTTSEVTLVCVSAGGDFETIRNWCDSIVLKLEKDHLSESLSRAALPDTAEYSASSLGIPGLRHFIYKSRQHIQITSPIFEDPYDGEDDKRRLITLYQTLHDAIHAKSGQEGTLKLQYIRTEKESVLGWITQPFELYITTSPLLPKTAVIGAANSVTRWIKKEESRLFLRDAPVF